MEKAKWKKVLGRFNKSELLKNQFGLKCSSIKGHTKKELIGLYADQCMKEKLLPADRLLIELKHFSCTAVNSVLWRAYRLEYADPTSLTAAVENANVFGKRLTHYLGDIYDYSLVHIMKQGGCWLCMHIEDKRLAPYTCYFFRRPPSPLLMVAGVRKTHLVTLLEAINLALNSCGCTDLDLTSKNFHSLLELVSNQHSQGPLSSYRLNQVDPNPLLMAGRHMPLPQPKAPEQQPNSVAEIQKAATDTFGINPLPTLEKFTFKWSTVLPNKSDIISCQVKFAGSSVLEGTKAAIAADCFTLPIPKTISTMPSFATNILTVEDT